MTAPEPRPPLGEPPVAVLGIDPGRRWTAGVLRVGDRPLDGWTLGPVDPDGVPDPSAIDDPHDIAAWARYMGRIREQIGQTVARHQQRGGGAVMLACEMMIPPGGRQIALANWLIPRQVIAGLLTLDPSIAMVSPNKHGKHRPVEEHYPPELWPARRGRHGGRPDHWGPSEARHGERDHERAAYDVAGVLVRSLAPTGVGA